ncbi:DUF4446 family protein [Salinactinospora qingdaonensis]|uniref:DUF4446 family protein n=1 Tax=Salinactinospora qingdaonensis TaxID=702744 RepID=A0ABP7FLK9_9ACTN
MLSTILAATGILIGLCGLVVGSRAHTKARAAVDESNAVLSRLRNEMGNGQADLRAVRDVALVRYDALEAMSGARSFSIAMLNAAGDGVVLTSINGRSETRTYAKAIAAGHANETLSPEEQQAIRAARMGQGAGDIVAEDSDAAVSTVSLTRPAEAGESAATATPAGEGFGPADSARGQHSDDADAERSARRGNRGRSPRHGHNPAAESEQPTMDRSTAGNR